jgi:hypothetical protein
MSCELAICDDGRPLSGIQACVRMDLNTMDDASILFREKGRENQTVLDSLFYDVINCKCLRFILHYFSNFNYLYKKYIYKYIHHKIKVTRFIDNKLYFDGVDVSLKHS